MGGLAIELRREPGAGPSREGPATAFWLTEEDRPKVSELGRSSWLNEGDAKTIEFVETDRDSRRE